MPPSRPVWPRWRRKWSARTTAIIASPIGTARMPTHGSCRPFVTTSVFALCVVTVVRGEVIISWRLISLPYPEPGIRLIRQEDIGGFNLQLTTLKGELAEAVEQLETHYGDLRAAARERLGRLFNANDYPHTLRGMFEVTWDFPSVEPPEYLRRLSPTLYRQECDRVQARFNEAVQLAEQAFIEELSRLVTHLTERLSGGDDGKPKIFRDSAVENLTDFFQRFRTLNIGSDQQLEELVAQAQRVVRGVAPQQLRDNAPLRQQIATQLSGVQATLDGLLVERPRRNIVRRPR